VDLLDRRQLLRLPLGASAMARCGLSFAGAEIPATHVPAAIAGSTAIEAAVTEAIE